MALRWSARKQVVAGLFLAGVSACGSSDTSTPEVDSGPGGGAGDAPARDLALAPDIGSDSATARDGSIGLTDAPAGIETSAEAPSLDLALPTGDLAQTGPDLAQLGLDQAQPGSDGVDAPYDPGPATPIVVNTGNTAQYNLGDGTWKLFYFDTEAGQIYVVSGLDGITHGYLDTSPSVSPSHYQQATDPVSGTLLFTAPTAQRYYLAVGVSGGGASGSFQVADGGKPISLGTTALSLTPADGGDAHYVYRFPINPGSGYSLTLEGPSQPNVACSVAPRPERATGGGLGYTIWGVGGSLPFTDETIPATSVANSTSGFYFIDIRILATIAFTITITETP